MGSFNDRLLMLQRPKINGEITHRAEVTGIHGNSGLDVFTVGRSPVNDLVVRGYFPRGSQEGRSGTVSRISCRLLCKRSFPHRVFLISRNGKAYDSRYAETEPMMGVETKIVKLWHSASESWCPVSSCDNKLEGLRSKPSISVNNGKRIDTENTLVKVICLSELADGSIIDVGGVALVFRSGSALARLGKSSDAFLQLLNQMKLQCPVQMSPLTITAVERKALLNKGWLHIDSTYIL